MAVKDTVRHLDERTQQGWFNYIPCGKADSGTRCTEGEHSVGDPAGLIKCAYLTTWPHNLDRTPMS